MPAMDRPLDPTFRRRTILKRATATGLSVSMLVAILIWGPNWLRPSISRDRIRTARVDSGPIEASITASGTVVPEIEQVLSSPVDARVIKILKRPGAVLAAGEPILQLDLSESVLAVERLSQSMALKQNQQSKTKLDLENTLIDLQSQWDVKNLELQSLKSEVARNRSLLKEGLTSEEVLRKSELDASKAAIELKKLEAAKLNAQRSSATQREGLELEMTTLNKEREEARRQLNLGTTKSDRSGVLTWVFPEEGGTVHRGEVVARIADLKTFRVDAAVSDVHANRIRVGLPARVKIEEKYLAGAVSNILPTIKDGVITLQVALDERSSPLLRSNLRADVLLITDRKPAALRIKKGPFINGGEGSYEVFVIRGDAAVKTLVRIGISSFDEYEVAGGLLAGDEVIISDMSDYMHLKEVKLK
ncbi:MAG TPA: efflux RND transporter periplasmic adaptor subunit [Acidobacteriota bacterium]